MPRIVGIACVAGQQSRASRWSIRIGIVDASGEAVLSPLGGVSDRRHHPARELPLDRKVPLLQQGVHGAIRQEYVAVAQCRLGMMEIEQVVGIDLLRAVPPYRRMHQRARVQCAQRALSDGLADGGAKQAEALPDSGLPLFR